MKNVINGICVGLAFLCVAIGAVGVVLPFLPTTPLFLLAAALFAKGSTRFHRWFLSTSLYRKHLDDLVRTRSMTRKSKISVLTSITVLLAIGFILSPIWHAKAVIVIVALAHWYFFLFRVRTVTEEEKERNRQAAQKVS